MDFIKKHPNLALLIAVVLSAIALHNTLFLGWVDWDDKVHIIDNPLIKNLSWENIKQMFLTPELNGSYVPLTELSWALNYKLGGLNPLGYHLVNLALHLGSVSLVFVLIRKLTANVLVAFLTALLFGVHPLHVEPVAWITGRKDLLYAFFFLGSLISYTNYITHKQRQTGFWILALVLFVMSLLSKGVAVVLPVLFFLIDYSLGRELSAKLIVEKLPFFALSLIFGFVAVSAQEQTVALESVATVPYHVSAVTASYSLALYLIQGLVPFQIGAFHPYPPTENTLPWYMLVSVAIPVVMLVALYFLRGRKWLFFGLGFLLISFLPVIQLIPVGGAIVADRYTYVPYIGAFLVISMLFVYWYEKSKKTTRIMLQFLIIGYVAFLIGTAHGATKIWRNSLNLWTNVIEQHPHDSKGYINRGRFYLDKGELALAESDLKEAERISPELPVVYQHFGLLYQAKKDNVAALSAFRKAVTLDSLYSPAWLNMAVSHMHLQQLDSALVYLDALERSDSSNVLVHINRGVIYERQSRFEQAAEEYGHAILKDKNDYKGYQYRAVVLYRIGRYDEALLDVEEWLARNPRAGKAYVWRSRIRFLTGEFVKAQTDIDQAIGLGTEVKEEYLKLLSDSLDSSEL